MQGLVDPNAIATWAVVGVAGFAVAAALRPGLEARREQAQSAKQTQQLIMAGAAMMGFYALRQFEGRGAAQDTQSTTLTALSERIATLFNRMQKAETAQQEHADEVSDLRSEVRVVTRSVDDLVKRMDKFFEQQQVVSRRR